jgi:hypothetical protein
MIKRKYVALAAELTGAGAVVTALHILLNPAVGLLAAGVTLIVIGVAIEQHDIQ